MKEKATMKRPTGKSLKQATNESPVNAAYADRGDRRFIVNASQAPRVYDGNLQSKTPQGYVNTGSFRYRDRDTLLSQMGQYGRPNRFSRVWKPVPNTEEWRKNLE
jgi:hypothetical protein